MTNRREVLAILAGSICHGQDISSRGVRPQARGKPFGARFTDVAREAGLREPVV
jgi:hypothetical protein